MQPETPTKKGAEGGLSQAGSEQQIYSIDGDKRGTSQEELFRKSSQARDIEAQKQRQKRGFFWRICTSSCCKAGYRPEDSAAARNLAGGPGEAATYQGPNIEGEGAGRAAGGRMRQRDSLLPPVEGQVPFHKDIDAISDDLSEDTRSEVSATDLAQEQQTRVAQDKAADQSKLIQEKGRDVLAMFGSTKPAAAKHETKPTASPLPGANPLLQAATKMYTETSEKKKYVINQRLLWSPS